MRVAVVREPANADTSGSWGLGVNVVEKNCTFRGKSHIGLCARALPFVLNMTPRCR